MIDGRPGFLLESGPLEQLLAMLGDARMVATVFADAVSAPIVAAVDAAIEVFAGRSFD